MELKHNPGTPTECGEKQFVLWYKSRNEKEVEANLFAAELLMPEAMFRRKLEKTVPSFALIDKWICCRFEGGRAKVFAHCSKWLSGGFSSPFFVPSKAHAQGVIYSSPERIAPSRTASLPGKRVGAGYATPRGSASSACIP
jgi:hypothetical protein